MRINSDQMHSSLVSTPLSPWRLTAVLLVGCGAAVARIGSDSPQDIARSSALLLLGLLLIWLLRPDSLRTHRWLTLISTCLVAVIAVAAWMLGFAYPFVVALVGTVLAYGALVRWSLPLRWPQRNSALAGLALGPLLLSMILWYRSPSILTFLLLGLLATAFLEMYARAHLLAAKIDSGVARAARAVGQGVTAVLAGLIMIVVIIPVNLLSRLFGYSPLNGGWATRTSAWLQAPQQQIHTGSGQPAQARSMAMKEQRPTQRVRLRGHLRLFLPAAVVLLIALVSGVGPLKLSVSDSEQEVLTGQDRPSTFTRPFEDDPAFEDAPWARNLRVNLLDAWKNLEFNAAVGGWRIKDVNSQYINVRNGQRRTTAPDPALGSPIVIWFFGGSAAFGAGQRDEHTIPSELVALAKQQGLPLEIHNFAVPATVNWQSAMLLISQLQGEQKPDLIVIYDGANDVALQGVLEAQGKGASAQPASLLDGELDQVLSQRATARAAESTSQQTLLPPSEARTPDQKRSPEASGQVLLERYSRGIEVIRKFSELSSVPVVIFWQPDIRTKQPQTTADSNTLAAVKVNEDSIKVWTQTSDVVRSGLSAIGVTDLSGVFDGQTEPIYWDTVHTNELGSRIVAEKMLTELQPTLSSLQQQRG
ncbi:MAG: SGNH/GDSL hydrolase family protein [Microthrixaceae bacterium]